MFASHLNESLQVAAVFPHWPIQRFLTENPHMKDQPVLLYRKVGRRQVVVGCNRLACKFGARVGLPMVQLPRRLAGAAIRHSVQDDQRRLNEVAMILRQFTPTVGLQTNRWEFPAGDSILLDLSRSIGLFGSVGAVEVAITNVCRDLDLQVRTANAPTIAAAWAWARYGSSLPFQKAGENLFEKDSAPLPEQSDWMNLPIAAFRTGEKNVESFQALGIECIDQVMQLPQASLPSRFGAELSNRISEFWGQRTETVQPVSSNPPDLWKHSLEHPSGDSQVLHAIIVALIRKVLKPIQDRQQGVLSLSVHLFCRSKPLFPNKKEIPFTTGQPDQDKGSKNPSSPDQPPYEFHLELVRPTVDADYLFSLLSVSLDGMKLKRPVTDLQVFVGRTVPYKRKQQMLFSSDRGQTYGASETATAKLVDTLVCRLGKKAVVQAGQSRHAVPERSFAWQVPLKKKNSRRYSDLRVSDSPGADRSSDHITAARLEQPARLYQNPVPIKIDRSVHRNLRPTGEHRYSVPGNFQVKKKNFSLVHAAGPWQVDSLWWEGDSVHRKYFRVTTEEGFRFLIFQSTKNGCWFLHGDFA